MCSRIVLTFLRSFKCLSCCAHYAYWYGKWEILDVVNEGMNYKTCTLFRYWSFQSKVWMKLGIYLNGWFEIYISLRRLLVLSGGLFPIHALFIQDHAIRNNLCNCVPLLFNSLNMLPLFVILINHLTMMSAFVLMLFPWTLDLSNLSKKQKIMEGSYRIWQGKPILRVS